MKTRKLQVILLKILITVMPFHYLLFVIILCDIPFLKLWRDFVIIVIYLLNFTTGKKIRVRFDTFTVISCLFFVYTLLYVFYAQYFNQAANIARVYLLPIFLFHAVRNIDFKEWEINEIFKILYYNTIIICFYGLFQAFILKENFLIALGYRTVDDGRLGAEFYLSNYGNSIIGRNIQRVISSFSAANICGYYLCIIFILFLFYRDRIRVSKKRYGLFMILTGVTIILTFSRSSWLGIAIALIIYARKQIKHFMIEQKNTILLGLGVVITIIITSSSLKKALVHIVFSSLSGKDTSVISHYFTINRAFEIIKDHPWGLGLGENGPRALNYGPSNLVESSILLMVFEFGILGTIIYFFDYINIALNALIHKKDKNKSRFILCLTGFVLIAFLNIPYIQEIECTSIYFILSGMMWNKRTEVI